TGSSGVDCAALGQAYESALDQAAQCFACKDADDCINGPVLPDTCNCPRGLNGGFQAANLVAAAKQALVDFQNAGCPFFACGKNCAVGTNWLCSGPDPGCIQVCHHN